MTFLSKIFFLASVVFFLLVRSSIGQLFENEDCRLSNGDLGKCKLQHNCPALKEIISNGTQPVICSFNQSKSIVCCPETQIQFPSNPQEPQTTSTTMPLSRGSSCTMESGSAGTCQRLRDCPEANTISTGSMPKICYFRKSTAIVCCPLRNTSTPGMVSQQERPKASEQRRTTTPQPFNGRTTTIPTPPARTSVSMCEHYSQFVFQLVQAPILLIVPHVTNDSQCHSEMRAYQTAARGIGVAQYMAFPHITSLGYGNESSIKWNCVGSLVSENYLLTAAGCITSPESGNVQWARIGDMEPSVYSPDTKEIQKVVEWKTPPGNRHRNSLALLRLERRVEFSGYRRPACLYSRPGLPEGYRFGTNAGWGMADWDNTASTSQNLRKQDLVFASGPKCRESGRPGRTRRQQQSRNRTQGGSDICVMLSQGGSSDCVGGLGSPLDIVLETPYCMTSILGVNTAGTGGCATPDKPALFTRVSDHIAWIESIIWT